MLKSSGSSCLSSGANKSFYLKTTHTNVTAAMSMYLTRELPLHLGTVSLLRTLNQTCWCKPALVTFKYPMIRGSAIHTAYRIFAAFFIVMGT